MLTLLDWSSVPEVAKVVAAAVAAARVVRVAKMAAVGAEAQILDGIQCHHRLTGSQLVQLIQL